MSVIARMLIRRLKFRNVTLNECAKHSYSEMVFKYDDGEVYIAVSDYEPCLVSDWRDMNNS